MGKNDYIGGGIFHCPWYFYLGAHVPIPGPGRRAPRALSFPPGSGHPLHLLRVDGHPERLAGRQRPRRTASCRRRGNVITRKQNYFNPVLVIILIAAFIALAPKLGFIITGAAVLLILMMKLRVFSPSRA